MERIAYNCDERKGGAKLSDNQRHILMALFFPPLLCPTRSALFFRVYAKGSEVS